MSRAMSLLDVDRVMTTARTSKVYSFADVIDKFGGDTALSRALAVPRSTVACWRLRYSIPAAYWTMIARAAQRRQIRGVTVERLAQLGATLPAPVMRKR
jgi:hypothetical protein